VRIARLKIENIKGIGSPAIEFRPGTLTLIRGGNGTGKSSIKDAVLSIFEGGCDPSWLHGWSQNPAKKGSIEMDVADDQGEVIAQIVKTVTLKKDGGGVSASLEIIDSNGVPIPAPKDFVEKLGQSWAVDPSAILNIDATTSAGRKTLMERLLAIMPVEFGPHELADAIDGIQIPGFNPAAKATLADLDKIRKYVEEMRKKVGVEARDAEGAYKDLSRTLPTKDEMAEDWAAREAELRADESALQSRIRSEREGIQKEAQAERGKISEQAAKEEREAREVLQRALQAISGANASAMSDVASSEQAAYDQVTADTNTELNRISAELATAREKASQQERAKGAAETVTKMQNRWSEKADVYDRLTASIGKLDKAKKSKLENLPVEGLDFEGDKTLINGVEWPHVNTAKKYETCMQISALLAGELPFQVWDDVEHFTPENRQAVIDAAVAGGFQVIAAIAESGELRIESTGKEAR
jgi:hypothetical protein